MEAGFDHLLLRSKMPRRFARVSGMLLLILGGILLSCGIAYYVYAFTASSNLDELNYSVTVPQPVFNDKTATSPPDTVALIPAITLDTTLDTHTSPPQDPPVAAITQEDLPAIALPPKDLQGDSDDSNIPVITGELEKTSDVDQVSKLPPNVKPISEPLAPPEPNIDKTLAGSPVIASTPPQIRSSAITSQQLYPGESIKATYWNNPFQSETASSLDSSYLRIFKPIDSTSFQPLGALTPPTHLVIPSVAVDSEVNPLEILNLGDSQAYETPKHVVGHISERSNPGERGSVWLFGHLESPVSGEGNVFYNLPKISSLLRQGQDVYAIVYSEESSYLYKITETFVIHQDQMTLSYAHLKTLKPKFAQLDPSGANIHFVACVPRLVYDHRIVVSGTLVGVSS